MLSGVFLQILYNLSKFIRPDLIAFVDVCIDFQLKRKYTLSVYMCVYAKGGYGVV